MILSTIGILADRSPAVNCIVTQCFTSNGTWSCCPGTFCIEVVAIGAGGAGAGGAAFTTPSCASTGGGGGGGGGVSICGMTSGFGTSQCVIVGSGSDSCFGPLVTATKGTNGCASIRNTTAFPEISTGSAPGGVGNYACGGAGGFSCTAAGETTMGGGGSCATAPGGGGGGGSVWLRSDIRFFASFGGGGGGGSTLCGITLGSGGRGGAGVSTIPPGTNTGRTTCPGASFGGGGGGGAAASNGICQQSGEAGAPGIVKVTQYIT